MVRPNIALEVVNNTYAPEVDEGGFANGVVCGSSREAAVTLP